MKMDWKILLLLLVLNIEELDFFLTEFLQILNYILLPSIIVIWFLSTHLLMHREYKSLGHMSESNKY